MDNGSTSPTESDDGRNQVHHQPSDDRRKAVRGRNGKPKTQCADTGPTVAPFYPLGLDVGKVLDAAGCVGKVTKHLHWVEAYVAAICEQLKWRGVRRDEFGQVWHVCIGTWVPRRLHVEIRMALVKAGVLEVTDYRPPNIPDRIKGECRSYRFAPPYRSMHWAPRSIPSAELSRLRATPSADWERHKQKEQSHLQPVHLALRPLAEQIILTGKGAKHSAAVVPFLTDRAARWFKVDWQNRVHHPVVQCNRTLRRYLRVRGQEGQTLWSADVRAAQLMLLVLFLSGRYTLHPDDYRGEIAGPPYRTRGQEEREIVEIVAHCSSLCKNDAFRILQTIASGGCPYVDVLASLNRGLPAGVAISRKDCKQGILCVTFGRPKAMEHQDAGKALGEVYPGLYAAIQYAAARLKPGALSRIMQRVESRIMIGRVAKRLVAEMPGVVFATMHDGILAQERHIHRIKEIIEQEWTAEVNAEPFVKVESTVGVQPEEGTDQSKSKMKRRKKANRSPSRKWEKAHKQDLPH